MIHSISWKLIFRMLWTIARERSISFQNSLSKHFATSRSPSPPMPVIFLFAVSRDKQQYCSFSHQQEAISAPMTLFSSSARNNTAVTDWSCRDSDNSILPINSPFACILHTRHVNIVGDTGLWGVGAGKYRPISSLWSIHMAGHHSTYPYKLATSNEIRSALFPLSPRY